MIDLKNSKKSDELFSELSQSEFKSACISGTISAEIRNKRHQMEMTQKEFAEFIGVTQGMVSKWETPGYNFSVNALVELFSKLNIDFDVVINEKPVLKPKKNSLLEYINSSNVSTKWKTSTTNVPGAKQNEIEGAA